MPYEISAPGSMMLLGEYAVLHGKRALVCAIDQRIKVVVRPRKDLCINISSDLYGTFATDLKSISIQEPFHFVLATIKYFKSQLLKQKQGLDIDIHSQLSDKMGFGSSAAVVAATVAGLSYWLEKSNDQKHWFLTARKIVRQVQGVASGSDVSASIYGGLVGYRAEPFYLEKFNQTFPITACYAGFKTKTADAIALVREQFLKYPILFRSLFQSIGACVEISIDHLKKSEESNQSLSILGEMMNRQQGLMEALGVSLPRLNEILATLKNKPGIMGAKISGSGLGDCVIGIGASINDADCIPLTMAREGVTIAEA